MSCEIWREALSARLDGEIEPAETQSVDEHLMLCQACRAWERDSAKLNRLIRVRRAVQTPDLTEQVVAAVVACQRPGRSWTWRYLLGAVSLVQLCLGLSELLGFSHMGMTMSADGGEHLFNESSAWNVALAVGLVIVAFRPSFATGLIPTLGAFLLVLSFVSVRDVIDGNADLTRVTSHGVLVVALVFLVVVHRQHVREPGPGQRRRGSTELFAEAEPMPDRRTQPSQTQPRRIRPAGRRTA